MTQLKILRISLASLTSILTLSAQIEPNMALKLDTLSETVAELRTDFQELRQMTNDLLEKQNIQLLIGNNNELRNEISKLNKENNDLIEWKRLKQQETIALNNQNKNLETSNKSLTLQVATGESAYLALLDQSVANLIQTGTTENKEYANDLLTLAKQNESGKKSDIEKFIIATSKLDSLTAEFNQFTNRDEFKKKCTGLYGYFNPFPGLRTELNFLVYRVNAYCEYEQKLLTAISVSQTQSIEENRQMQLQDWVYEFNYYPALKAELIKLMEDRNYVFQPKCTN